MYPVLEEGVTLRAFRREGSHEMVYCAENPQGREFEISRRLYRALMETGLFRYLVYIRVQGGQRRYEAEVLP